MIIAVNTASSEAEVSIYDGGQVLANKKWHSGQNLSKSLHSEINNLLAQSRLKLDNLKGIVVFEGPGSFTGLRIGIAATSALGFALKIPVAGAHGKNWQEKALKKLASSPPPPAPYYHQPAYTTKPKK